jgi:hypothetical protein
MPDVIAYAIAKFNYEPQREDELRLSKGDHLNILDKSADGWWRVLNQEGSSGWIPSNYVDETSVPPTNKTNDPSNDLNGSSQILQSYNYNNGLSNYPSTHINNFSGNRVLEVINIDFEWYTRYFRSWLLYIALMPKIRKNYLLEKVNNSILLTIRRMILIGIRLGTQVDKLD